jgi:hypothetical protein
MIYFHFLYRLCNVRLNVCYLSPINTPCWFIVQLKTSDDALSFATNEPTAILMRKFVWAARTRIKQEIRFNVEAYLLC